MAAKRKPTHGGSREGAGRPTKGDEPRSEPIPVKLTPSELDGLRDAAEQKGQTLTTLVRKALGLDSN